MSEVAPRVLAAFAGLLLGGLFFGGLWWTVRRGVVSSRPAAWFLGSLLVRMSILLAGVYVVGRDHWDRMLLCLLGVVVGRLVVTRWTAPLVPTSHGRAREADHAS